MPRIEAYFRTTALVALFGLALWLRATSLESMPYPDGDEAWYGIQVQGILSGQHFSILTDTGNPLNPLFAGLMVPLLLVFRPALWILRVPSLVCGILVLILAYKLVSKLFDKTTGLLASGMLATLPVMILFSRISMDASQTPLFSLIALYVAFRGWRIATLGVFALLLLIHPTNVFLAPTLIAILAVRLWERTAASRRDRVISLSTLFLIPGLFAMAFGLYILSKPKVQNTYSTAFQGLDWPRFFTMYGRLFLGIGQLPMAEWNTQIHDWAFRIIVFSSLLIGIWPLTRSRRWDVVAMILGLVASVSAFHIVAGHDAIRPAWVAYLRYGLFAVVPTVLALSCLIRETLMEATTIPRRIFRSSQTVGLYAIGALMLLSVTTNWFGTFAAAGHESPWTFQTDSRDPSRRVLSFLLHDRMDPKRHRTEIYAQDQWSQRPIQYLAGRRPDLEVRNLEAMATSVKQYREALKAPMDDGAYALGFAGGRVEAAVTSMYPAHLLRRWDAKLNGGEFLIVYRLKRADEPTMVAGRPAEALR